ncbi:MAG: tRNA 2-thiocytidine biosynthesis protein TtcA [Gammaproteobacteria bacterium]|nr:tRNA 2-thiocytidine biosynthesis protein TtcA [Gammaproteobacteria bacterium]
MIKDGDRILLGLSGGKDSLTLLNILRHLQACAPVKFEIGVITVDPMTKDFDPSPLKPYVTNMGLPYFFESQPIMDMGKEYMTNPSYCSWCSRMKRGVMYSTARREGYNVLVLAQHLDDLAESFLMSAFHNGQLRTMKANYTVSEGDLRVIRPLVYVREYLTREYAEMAGLPVIMENCPACFDVPTQRQHMKTLLANEESQYPNIYKNLLHAMRPLMDIKDSS